MATRRAARDFNGGTAKLVLVGGAKPKARKERQRLRTRRTGEEQGEV